MTPLAAPLAGVRNSHPLTDTEQDGLSELIANVVFKRKKKDYFLLTTAVIFFLYQLVLSEEVKSSSPC